MQLDRRLPHAYWAPHLFISAKTGKGVHRVLPMVEQVFSAFDTRIGTSRLNRFLQEGGDPALEAALEARGPNAMQAAFNLLFG